MEKYIMYLSCTLIAVQVLTVWTNIVAQITKKLIAWDKFPTQVWVFIVAMVSTLITAVVAAQLLDVIMLWYRWVAAVAIGILVCYAAMYGYDNLYKQIMETLKKIKDILEGKQ